MFAGSFLVGKKKIGDGGRLPFLGVGVFVSLWFLLPVLVLSPRLRRSMNSVSVHWCAKDTPRKGVARSSRF